MHVVVTCTRLSMSVAISYIVEWEMPNDLEEIQK